MKFSNIAFNAVAIIITAFFVFTAALAVSGSSVYAVATESMLPELKYGDAVIVRPCDGYAVGDIVTAYLESGGTFTHRIVRLDADGFITKGDNNPVEDPKPLPGDRVIGKVIFSLPYIGRLSLGSSGFNGRAAALVLAGLLIAWELIRFIVFKIKEAHKEDKANEKA